MNRTDRNARDRSSILAVLITTVMLAGFPLSHASSDVQLDWLGYVNSYRALAGLSPLTEDPALSDGDAKHANYMVQNNVIQHSEDPGNPFYTSEGDAAARASNLFLGFGSSCFTDDRVPIDGWVSGPFHAMGVLRTTIVRTGFGTATTTANGTCRKGAALDVLRGTGSAPVPSYPYEWPGNGTSVALLTIAQNESPDPLTGCPGYSNPPGLPVYAFFGGTTNVTTHSFSSGGQPLEHCVYDGSSYTNPDGNSQTVGRQVLAGSNAVVLIPRAPLVDGTSYTASITSSGVTATWTFAASTSGGGGTTPATIMGTVFKVSNSARNATMKAKICAGGDCRRPNDDGTYSFTVPAGTISIKAKIKHRKCSTDAGEPSPVTVTVGAGETRTIDWLCSKKR
jgi:hypothetical protein